MAGQYIYNNKDLMREIYLFDSTFHIFFRENIIINNTILDAAHTFWYEKYMRVLRMQRIPGTIGELQNVLEIQQGFFDTLYQLSPEIFGDFWSGTEGPNN